MTSDVIAGPSGHTLAPHPPRPACIGLLWLALAAVLPGAWFSLRAAVAEEAGGSFVSAGGDAAAGGYRLQDSLGGGVVVGEQAAAGTFNRSGWLASVNNPPAARDLSVRRAPKSNVKIAIAKLLALASDPDGDPVSLVGFDPTSASGGAIIRDGSWLICLVAAHDAPDTFDFTVADDVLAATPARVTIALSQEDHGPALNIARVTRDGNDVIIHFAGIPGQSYRVQSATDLSAPVWVTLGNAVATANGLFEFRDVDPAPAARYYRTVAP